MYTTVEPSINNCLNVIMDSFWPGIKAHNFIFSGISLLNDTSSGRQRTLFYRQSDLLSYKNNLTCLKLVI